MWTHCVFNTGNIGNEIKKLILKIWNQLKAVPLMIKWLVNLVNLSNLAS